MSICTVEFENVSVTTAGGDRDLFYLAPADDKPITILGIFVGNASTLDIGDAQEEMLRWRLIRGHATVGSGGSVATPVNLAAGGGAPSFTARTNDTTIASAGTPVNIHSDAFNVRQGLQFMLPEYMQGKCSQGQGSVVVRLMAGPLDDIAMSGTIYVEEQD